MLHFPLYFQYMTFQRGLKAFLWSNWLTSTYYFLMKLLTDNCSNHISLHITLFTSLNKQ